MRLLSLLLLLLLLLLIPLPGIQKQGTRRKEITNPARKLELISIFVCDAIPVDLTFQNLVSMYSAKARSNGGSNLVLTGLNFPWYPKAGNEGNRDY